MHPIQALTTGSELGRLMARVRYGVLTATEALARPELSPSDRKELSVLLAEELADESLADPERAA